MFLVNVDSSLEIMDAMINDEIVSHTEAKKLMVKQVKPAHRDLLLDTLNHTNKEFSFSSFANDDDIHGMTKTKKIIAKMYKKYDLLLKIEEYKADTSLINQFNEIIKQNKIIEQSKQKQIELEKSEAALKHIIELRAKEIMNKHNDSVTAEINLDSFDPFELLTSMDEMLNNTMTYEEAYNQAKKEIMG